MDERTSELLLAFLVEELGGIVEVDGEQKIDKVILRGVVESFISEVGKRLTEDLSAVTADDPEATGRIPELVAAGMREVTKKIDALLPVIYPFGIQAGR